MSMPRPVVAFALAGAAVISWALYRKRRKDQDKQQQDQRQQDKEEQQRVIIEPMEQPLVPDREVTNLHMPMSERPNITSVQEDTTQVSIKELLIYPIKSCQGVSLPCAKLSRHGFLHDREFVLCGPRNDVERLTARMKGCEVPEREEDVDPAEAYLPVTLRNTPMMALVSVHVDACSDDMRLIVHAPDMPELKISEKTMTPITRRVQGTPFGGEPLCGQDCGEAAGSWFSRLLDVDGDLQLRLRLVRFSGERHPDMVDNGDLRYQDVAPLLVMTTASINKLACEQGLDLSFNELVQRFRPNIVVDTSKADEEDLWEELQLSTEAKLVLYRPCDRCQVPRVDPKSLKEDRDKDPCKFLPHRKGKQLKRKPFRFANKVGDRQNQNKIYFGMYGAVSLAGSDPSVSVSLGERLLVRAEAQALAAPEE
jgi:uncharacterized protein YcbX